MAVDTSKVESVLTKLGFTAEKDHPAADKARVKELSHNGEYKVLGAWTNDEGVHVHVEQNTAPEEYDDGGSAVITYPPVLVVQHPGGGPLAVSFGDLEAFERILGGDTEFEVK